MLIELTCQEINPYLSIQRGKEFTLAGYLIWGRRSDAREVSFVIVFTLHKKGMDNRRRRPANRIRFFL